MGPPKRNDIEPKLQPLCNIISQNVQSDVYGLSQYEFNHKLHEWLLLPPQHKAHSSIKSKSTPKAFMTLTPSSDENVSNNTFYPKTILIQSHSLNMNTGSDECAITPIGYNAEFDEKIAINLSPPSTTLQQKSKSVDNINTKTKKNKKKKRQRIKKSKTNKFMSTIKVGQTVKLTQ